MPKNTKQFKSSSEAIKVILIGLIKISPQAKEYRIKNPKLLLRLYVYY